MHVTGCENVWVEWSAESGVATYTTYANAKESSSLSFWMCVCGVLHPTTFHFFTILFWHIHMHGTCMAHTYAVFFLVSTFLSFAVEANKICVICTQTRATTNIHIPHTYAYIHTFIHLYVRLYKQTANSSMLFMQHAEATTNNERFNTPSLYRCIISAFVCMEVSEPVRIGWWVKTL